MAPVILSLGYDTERPYGSLADTTEGDLFRAQKIAFVNRLSHVLDSQGVPRTHFILGHFLDRARRTFSESSLREVFSPAAHPLIEIGQHSYSHPIIKATTEGDKTPIDPQSFLEDVKRANRTIEQILGVRPCGIRTPRGYEQNLSDLPEVVMGLSNAGFSYVSSWLRGNNTILAPLTLERQPRRYESVSPSLVEMPSHGWQDAAFLEEFKARNLGTSDDALQHYTALLDHARSIDNGNNPVFVSLCLHPWAVMRWDPNLEIHKRIVAKAHAVDARILTYMQAANESLAV